MQHFQKRGEEQHGGEDHEYNHRTPTHNVVKGFIDVFTHYFFVINQKNHAYQHHGQENSVYNLRPQGNCD